MLARRVRRLVLLTAGVLAVHLWFAGDVLLPRLGAGATENLPRRIEVAFVRELAPTQPAAVAPAPRRRAPAARAPQAAASAPAPLASTPTPPDEAVVARAEAPSPAAEMPAPVDAPASAPALAAAPAASAPEAVFYEWPPSTRLSYRLTGNYRGPVEGQAQVEWLRSGTRYQVFMEVSVGPAVAPLIGRRVSSDGEITSEGLSPRRYDEETKVVLRDTRRLTIFLEPEFVRLPDGSVLPRPAGVQDSASQFVHLTWLFTTQPQWLQPGRSIVLPLALPRRIEPWTYDVLGTETLATPAGAVETVHVKPRREPKPGGDLAAEIWVAPTLQYLPVRILIRQDAETFIDLLLERLPEQAAEPAPGRTVPGEASRRTP